MGVLRGWIGRLGLIAIGAGAAIGLLEIGLRVFYPQPLYAIRYCYLGWCHVPGAAFVHGAETREFVTHVQYNSRGLRDHEYPYEKPPGVRRILVFGDSFVEALEVELEQTHPKLLERKLYEAFPERRFEVINFGVSAYSVAQVWRYLETEGVRYQPDLIVVFYTGRIGARLVELVEGRPVFREPRFGWSEILFRELLTFVKSRSHAGTFLGDRLKWNLSLEQFWRRLLATQGETPGRSEASHESDQQRRVRIAVFRAMVVTARAHGSRLLVAVASGAGDLARDETLRHGAVDIVEIKTAERHHFPLDRHYNAAGHRAVARMLFTKIVADGLLGVN